MYNNIYFVLAFINLQCALARVIFSLFWGDSCLWLQNPPAEVAQMLEKECHLL